MVVNCPKYSDVTILCEDGKSFYASKVILAARCEVFDGILYNKMKESHENRIYFPEIKSTAMEAILNYLYTGSCTVQQMRNEDVIDIYHAADYFQLNSLLEYIVRIIGFFLQPSTDSYFTPELLSRALVKLPLSEKNPLVQLLAECISSLPISAIEYNQLTFTALKFLLTYAREKGRSLATTEYEVFRYIIIHSAHQVSKKAVEILDNYLPIPNRVNDTRESNNVSIHNTEYHRFRPQLFEIINPLLEFVDIRRIEGKNPIFETYPETTDPKNLQLSEINPSDIQTTSVSKLNFIWEQSACGSDLTVEGEGLIVRALATCKSAQNVRGTILIENGGKYEWDLIVDKGCKRMYIGICANEDFSFEEFAGRQSNGWVFSGAGIYWNDNSQLKRNETYSQGDKVTVHLDMDEKTLAFSVNDTKYPVATTWKKPPSKVYPIVSLIYPGQIRIQPH
ncbi:19409_t:CDS:2 [Funneliformis geosporum]|nr:19409_t:CDS:2 [Funneliformis geosporum]